MKINNVTSDQDIKLVATLAQSIWNEYYLELLGEKQIQYMLETLQSFDAIKKTIEEDGMRYRIIEVDKAYAGYFAIKEEGDALLISKFYILKEYRYKGIFRKSLKILELEVYKDRLKSLKLFVNKQNESKDIYENLGFKIVNEWKFDIGQGYIMDDYEMQKDVVLDHIKLIVSDVDGTLLGPNYDVTQRTRDTVLSLKDHGIHFAIATGRAYESALKIAQSIPITEEGYGLICLNGFRTYHLPHTDYHQLTPITYDDVYQLEQLGKEYYMGILYCFDDRIYFQMSPRDYEDYKYGMEENGIRYFKDNMVTVPISSLDEIKDRFDHGDTILKVVYVQTDDYMTLVKHRVETKLKEGFEMLMVGNGWGEMMPKTINKAQAVLDYAKELGIEPHEIMAFGDAENDLMMLETVGIGVGMANGRESILKVCDLVTESNNEDGVACEIERYLAQLKRKI